MATRKTTPKSEPTSSTKKSNSVSAFPLKSLLIPLAIVVVVILLWMLRGQFVAATVNGEPISRVSLLLDLEKKQGKNTLENMITERLILQEADVKKLSATEAEVTQEVENIKKNLESQGQQLEPLLSAQGMTLDDLKRQIKFQVLLKKMVGTIQVADKEVEEYMEKNKEMMPESTDAAALKAQVKQQLEQQKADEGVQKIIEALRAKAKIEYLLKL